MPLITVDSKIEVEGESTVTASDIISFKMNIKYDLLPEKCGPGYIHSQNYPFLKRSNWYIVIVDEQTKENVIQIDRLTTQGDSNVIKFEMKQRFGRAGKFQFHCFVMNDSFVGFDKDFSLEVDVLRDDPNRVIEEYSKEDLDAVKGPTMIQQMMTGEEEEDDESSDDNPEVLLKKLEEAGLKTPEAQKLSQMKQQQETKKSKVATELVE